MAEKIQIHNRNVEARLKKMIELFIKLEQNRLLKLLL